MSHRKTTVLHETCTEFFDTHGEACKTCSDAPNCTKGGYKPPKHVENEGLATVIGFAEGRGYKAHQANGADHFVLI